MKNHSRVIDRLSLENINTVKLASEACQENFAAFLATKYDKIAKLEHLVCQKVGGLNPLVSPLLKVFKIVMQNFTRI